MSRSLIAADAGKAFDALARRLTTRAVAIGATVAAAHAETRALAMREDDRRWRRADLVWPLFAKG